MLGYATNIQWIQNIIDGDAVVVLGNWYSCKFILRMFAYAVHAQAIHGMDLTYALSSASDLVKKIRSNFTMDFNASIEHGQWSSESDDDIHANAWAVNTHKN